MRRTWILWLVVACDDGTDTATDSALLDDADSDADTDADSDADADADSDADTDTGDTGAQGGFCDVRRVFNRDCVVCHNSVSLLGGLDLQTDPWAATVGVTSAAFGDVLVEPGDSAGSLLWRKMNGSQAVDEGGRMPAAGAEAADIELVRAWIDDGASSDCGGTTTTPPGPYHPKGWSAPDVHGMATKFQTETDCRTCHGPELDGGSSGVSCSSCHSKGWETNCTYCHGGVLSNTGAPPEGIDDDADPATIPFPPHERHGEGRISPVFDCVQCHEKPTEALTVGHLFDDPTAGLAEVVFPIPASSWDTTTITCSNLYCHGDGQGANGRIVADAGARTCHSCHPDRTSSRQEWGQMSGEHSRHLGEGFQCDECHPDAVNSNQIDQPELHVNGTPDVDLPGNMTFNAGNTTCSGNCHGQENHQNRRW